MTTVYLWTTFILTVMIQVKLQNAIQKKRREIMKRTPCPSTGKTPGACPGYEVDYIQALKHGGADDPSNMQWQMVDAAKAKDKRE